MAELREPTPQRSKHTNGSLCVWRSPPDLYMPKHMCARVYVCLVCMSSLCVCMYVGVYLSCVHVYMHVCMHVHVHLCMFAMGACGAVFAGCLDEALKHNFLGSPLGLEVLLGATHGHLETAGLWRGLVSLWGGRPAGQGQETGGRYWTQGDAGAEWGKLSTARASRVLTGPGSPSLTWEEPLTEGPGLGLKDPATVGQSARGTHGAGRGLAGSPHVL